MSRSSGALQDRAPLASDGVVLANVQPRFPCHGKSFLELHWRYVALRFDEDQKAIGAEGSVKLVEEPPGSSTVIPGCT